MIFPVLGVPPSQITHVRDSMRNTANELAALQAVTTRHRNNHAASTPRALALARCRKKFHVSSDSCPPFAHVKTTGRDFPNWSGSSGHRFFFHALAVSKKAPSTAPQSKGHTVLSTASWRKDTRFCRRPAGLTPCRWSTTRATNGGFEDGPRTQTEVPASDGEIIASRGVISRSPHGKINVMLDSVVTKEAHLDIFCDNTHSNNTSEPTAKIEALSTPANWRCETCSSIRKRQISWSCF